MFDQSSDLPQTWDFEPVPGVVLLQEPVYRSLGTHAVHSPFQACGPLSDEKAGHATKLPKLSSDQLLSSKLLSFQFQAPMQLKPLPVWIAASTSFTSFLESQELFKRVLESLQTEPVDLASVQEKGKIRGIVFGATGFARFQVQLFQADHEIVVEFQRREGEALLLISLYRAVVASLGSAVSRQWAEEAAAAVPTVLPDLPEPSQPDRVLSTLDSLLTLAASSYEDQQKEAVTGLVALSTQHAKILVDASSCTRLILVLLQLLTSNNLLEIVRGSAVCLAVLLQAYAARTAAAPPFPPELGENLTSMMMGLLEAPALLASLDTKRQASQSLQSIAKADPTLLSNYRRTLNKYANSKDELLRLNVQKTLQLISV